MRPLYLVIGLSCVTAVQAQVAPTLDAELMEELAEIHDLDQGGRALWNALRETYDGPVPDSIRVPFWTALERIDAANFARLDSIVSVRGWPGQSVAGEEGARTAFLVVQHAPLDVQEEYLSVLEAAVGMGEAEPWQLALLTDRVLVRRGLPQRYGSQFMIDPETGARAYNPVEDPDGLDARRDAIGLPPHPVLGKE